MYNNLEENKKRKALLQLCRGDKVMSLFEHKGKVTDLIKILKKSEMLFKDR